MNIPKKPANGSLSFTLFPKSLTEWQKEQLSKANSPRGAHCLLSIWNNATYKDLVKGSFCDGVWDNVYCWPPTTSGTVLTKTCSEILPGLRLEPPSRLTGNVTRECLEDGTWANQKTSIYEECAKSLESYAKYILEESKQAPMMHYILFFGSLFSLVCLSGSLRIFYQYRCLWSDRVTIQAQLILSLVLRFIMMFIITEPFVFGHRISYRDVGFLCETILVLFLYATFASVTWMFIQGLYLNVTLMIVAANVNTQRNLRIYSIIGWVVPAVFLCAYVITMVLKEQEKCWHGYSKMNEMWILLGPIMFELVVNGLFLCNILRILLNKLRNSNSRQNSSQIKAAAKATAILFPVLGINNLILLYNPGGGYNKYFVALNTFFGSTQGIFVAIVYCFANKEVIAAIRRSIQRLKARRIDIANPNIVHNNNQPEPARLCTMELHVVNPKD